MPKQEKEEIEALKVVIVGDGAVGKSCLLICIATGKFPTEYVPTVMDNFELVRDAGSKPIKLEFWDTMQRGGYSRARTLSYPNTDVFVILYAPYNLPSFRNISERWIPELTQHCPKTPVILVRSKSDLTREQLKITTPGPEYIDFPEACKIAEGNIPRMHAHVQLSALTGEGISELLNILSKMKPLSRSGEKMATKTGTSAKSSACTLL